MQANDALYALLVRKQRQDEAKRAMDLQQQYPRTFTAGVVPSELQSMQDDLNEDEASGVDAQKRLRTRQDQLASDASFMSPEDTAVRAAQQKDKLAQLMAPAQAQAAGALDVEKEKNRGAAALQKGEQDFTTSLMGGGGAAAPGKGGINSGTPGSYKMSIGPSGKPSFSPVMMPALVTRAHDQLVAARDQTINALHEAERMYPGINQAANGADEDTKGGGWGSFLMGSGPKYGGALDMAGAANDRLKYTVGIPTPFAKLAQEASFGNIEQMAGQLPGVRGLATITPLFREHQSRWGHETPLATVQRLRHMAQIMDQTIGQIEGGVGSEEQ